jgi:hypothetical protein
MWGLSVAGLGTVVQGDMAGLNLAGLAVVSQGEMTGLNFAGLALVGDGGVRGLSVAGLAVVGQGRVSGLAVTLGAIESGERMQGLVVAGYRVKSPLVEGLAVPIAWLRADQLRGVSLSAYNRVRIEQRGLAIGLLNYARRLGCNWAW